MKRRKRFEYFSRSNCRRVGGRKWAMDGEDWRERRERAWIQATMLRAARDFLLACARRRSLLWREQLRFFKCGGGASRVRCLRP